MRREIRIGTEFDLNRVAVLSIAFSKSRGGKLAGCDEKNSDYNDRPWNLS